MAAPINLRESSVEVGGIKPVSDSLRSINLTEQPYDVSADGQRLLMNTLADDPRAAPLTLVVNALAGVRK